MISLLHARKLLLMTMVFMRRHLNVTCFSTMLVVDGTNKVEFKDQEAMHWLNKSFAIAKYLNF